MKTTRKPPFFAIAAATFIAAGLLSMAVSPKLLAWRRAEVNKLILLSKSASSQSVSEQYLREAMTIGWGGAEAPNALANYYLSLGRYDKAWRVLRNWPLPQNYTQLGDYALRAQDFVPAQQFYARAIKQKSTATAYVGLAAAQFNQGDKQNGCANAAKASKLDLSSDSATQMAGACLILNPAEKNLQRANFPDLNSTQLQSGRGIGVFLIANRVYVEGEKHLLASESKTPADWLTLAQLASTRGEYKLAAERGEKGIVLDRANPGLNKLLADSYKELGDSRADLYVARYKSLPLDKP